MTYDSFRRAQLRYDNMEPPDPCAKHGRCNECDGCLSCEGGRGSCTKCADCGKHADDCATCEDCNSRACQCECEDLIAEDKRAEAIEMMQEQAAARAGDDGEGC